MESLVFLYKVVAWREDFLQGRVISCQRPVVSRQLRALDDGAGSGGEQLVSSNCFVAWDNSSKTGLTESGLTKLGLTRGFASKTTAFQLQV